MSSCRLPRFNRSVESPPLQLTESDRRIVMLVHRYRFLRSTQIVSLLNSKSQPIIRRLQRLFHHGYLERPRAQLDYFHKGGSQPIIYGLGNKGISLLQPGNKTKARWGPKNRSVGRIFLEHCLMVSEIMVRLETGCRLRGVRLILEDELLKPSKKNFRFKWNVKLSNGIKLGVIPDRAFALEYLNEGREIIRVHFFLEADRGSMPVKRRSVVQTSFFRKLLAYEATWSQSLHRDRFGFNRFRVVTVTSSAARSESIIAACSELKRGHGLFLFTDKKRLECSNDILSLVWQTATPSKTGTLIEPPVKPQKW